AGTGLDDDRRLAAATPTAVTAIARDRRRRDPQDRRTGATARRGHRGRAPSPRVRRRDGGGARAEPGLDTPLLIRTRAYLGIHDVLDPFRFAVEFQDSRRYGSRFEPDNRDINEFDLTGLYADLYFREALGRDALNHPRPLSLRAGRMNFEFLDRRLLGNNQWRNNANTFEGFRITLGHEANDWQLDLLAVQPLLRREYDFDRPVDGQWVYAAIGHWRRWSEIITLEPYYLGLMQDERPGVAERRIHSAALRGYGVVPGTRFDFDFDAVFQFGTDAGRTHRAFGFTGEIGYTFPHPWHPRLSAFYGYASGDRDPDDDRSERFERFYGFARPWSANDYIQWENIHAPKARLEIQPRENFRMDAGWSWYWLASDTDRWNVADLRDPTGRSGSFMGHEFDARARWTVNRHIEAILGYAHFTPGGFTRNAGKGRDSDFLYLEITLNAF
ncbi:MAG: alginate export family protein, partial [Chthoniobacteraceae bacterium]